MKNILLIITTLAIVGCASSPDEIPAAYVSPLQYRSYDCDMLAQEMASISSHVSQAYGAIKKKSDSDDTTMGVGMILFWPALFALDGDGPEAQEYARLKGEYRAVEKAMIQKKCDMTGVENPIQALEEEDRKKKEESEFSHDEH